MMAFKQLSSLYVAVQPTTRMTREQIRAHVYANYHLESADAKVEVIDVDTETAIQ